MMLGFNNQPQVEKTFICKQCKQTVTKLMTPNNAKKVKFCSKDCSRKYRDELRG